MASLRKMYLDLLFEGYNNKNINISETVDARSVGVFCRFCHLPSNDVTGENCTL